MAGASPAGRGATIACALEIAKSPDKNRIARRTLVIINLRIFFSLFAFDTLIHIPAE
jgi:hypothetical protein